MRREWEEQRSKITRLVSLMVVQNDTALLVRLMESDVNQRLGLVDFRIQPNETSSLRGAARNCHNSLKVSIIQDH